MSNSPEVTLREAVRGASTPEIDAFAQSSGGYAAVVQRVLEGLATRVLPHHTGRVAFEIADTGSWTVSVNDGSGVLRVGADDVEATVQMTAPDFLRMITRDVAVPTLSREGRFRITGDPGAVARFFAAIPQPVELSVLVRGDQARVWRAITEETTQWFAEYADVSSTSFDFWGRYTLDNPGREAGRHPVLEWQPGRAISFEWRYRDATTTVELTLTPVEAGTAVTVRHQGAPQRIDGPSLGNFWGLALGYLRVWVELGERAPMLDMSADRHGGFAFDLEINAPIAKVFDTLHEQQAQRRRPGDKWEMDVGVPIGLEVLNLDSPREMQIGWTNGDRTSLVTWTLKDSGGRTRLTLVHSGMDPARDAGGEMQGFYDAGALVIKFMCERGDDWRWGNPVWS